MDGVSPPAHADGGWRATTRFHHHVDLRGDLRVLAPHVPSFRYLVDDLTRVPDDELAARIASAFARAVALTLKHTRGELFETLRRFGGILREVDAAPDAESALSALLSYTFYVRNDREATIRLGAAISERAKAMAISAADELIAEGFEKGQRTILRRLLELRFGPLPARLTDRLDHASADELTQWAERVLDARSLDALFAE